MKCMVIDGNSIINRAYYGIRPLTNREGLYTHAVFGFLTTLLRLKEEERPDALCVTFDLHAPTFRHKADEAYKATRKPMPEELRMQVPVLKEVLDTLNIPRYEMEGWEADDLIGTISRKCEAAGWDCVVVTGDKDSLQLITDHTKVKLVSTRMGQTTTKDMTPETFREQYGFDPIHMIDLKALMGDASDNIPGVPGVGEKTAMDLIQKYGSVDAIYEKLPDIDAKPAAIKKLTAGEDAARHSYWLATIVTDAPLPFDPAENRVQEPTPAVYPLFLKLEFSKLIEKMGLRPEETAPADAAPDVTVTAERITEESRAREVLELFRKADHVTVLALPDLSGVIADCDTGADTAQSAEFFFERYTGDWNALLNALFAADIKKVSHNVKDLMRTLLENGLNAEGFMFDTALAAYLVDATSGKYEIGQLFAAYFHTELAKPAYLEPDAFSLLGDTAGAEASFHSYTAAVEALYGVLAPKLKELNLEELYTTAELPLCRVLAEMELAGFKIDPAGIREFEKELSAKISETEARVYELSGEVFNILSPKQLGAVLFEKLELPAKKKTKSGYSTSADVLEDLRTYHPVIDEILEYRKLTKLRSTYVDGLLAALAPDGRVHTRFNQKETRTGRISSLEPNLQNIPIRTELGSRMRGFFVAGEGRTLIDADYSQIELRVLAHLSGDENMISAFTGGTDIHTQTAAQVFGVPEDFVTSQMRSRAKAVNFGIVYGIGAYSLGENIGVSYKEAQDYINSYLRHYSGVDRYMKESIEKAKKCGYAVTAYGRRRYLPELTASNHAVRAFGERVARNMPIQGTAADIIKIAMVKVRRRLAEENLDAKLIMQVHDELIVEAAESCAGRAAEILRFEMENAAQLSVPMEVSVGMGKTWLAAH